MKTNIVSTSVIVAVFSITTLGVVEALGDARERVSRVLVEDARGRRFGQGRPDVHHGVGAGAITANGAREDRRQGGPRPDHRLHGRATWP